MSYSDTAIRLSKGTGETPATVQQFLDRLIAAGATEVDAAERIEKESFADLNAELETAGY